MLLQVEQLADQGAKLIDKSWTVSDNPAITLLIAWQGLVIIILILAVIWLVRDKAKTTKEFVKVLTQVNNGIDKLADSVKDGDGNINTILRDIENRITSAIEKNANNVKESIKDLNQ